MLWTVRASMLSYGVTLTLWMLGRRYDRFARGAWTVAWALLATHIGLALHVVHRWDHADVIRHTADRTAALTGVRSGAGVYLNYMTLVVWAVDVAFLWRAGTNRYRGRSPAVAAAFHGFLLFIVFNATVVFGPPAMRWWAAGGFGVLALTAIAKAWGRSQRRRPGPTRV